MSLTAAMQHLHAVEEQGGEGWAAARDACLAARACDLGELAARLRQLVSFAEDEGADLVVRFARAALEDVRGLAR